MSKEGTYYKETIPKLIEEAKVMVDQCLKIVSQPIDADLADDKMHNVIKSKTMAMEQAQWASQEIDRLTNEMNGVTKKKESSSTSTGGSFAEQMAK